MKTGRDRFLSGAHKRRKRIALEPSKTHMPLEKRILDAFLTPP
jgi:hypothetical protein